MHTDVPDHPQSCLMLHTGEFRFTRPSLGAWLLYGLGTENQDLPGFITISPPTNLAAPELRQRLPARLYQATPHRRSGLAGGQRRASATSTASTCSLPQQRSSST